MAQSCASLYLSWNKNDALWELTSVYSLLNWWKAWWLTSRSCHIVWEQDSAHIFTSSVYLSWNGDVLFLFVIKQQPQQQLQWWCGNEFDCSLLSNNMISKFLLPQHTCYLLHHMTYDIVSMPSSLSKHYNYTPIQHHLPSESTLIHWLFCMVIASTCCFVQHSRLARTKWSASSSFIGSMIIMVIGC